VCDWSQRALDAAGRLGQRPLVAAATAMLALGHAVAGEIGQAGPVYDAAASLLAAMADEELGQRVDAAAYLASAATYLDRYDDAVEHAERALRLGRAAGHLHPTLLPALGAAHMLRGRLARSAEVLDAGLEAARLAGVTQGTAWMLRNRALLALTAGDFGGGRAMAEEALELTRRLDESVLSSWAALTVARASVMAGDDARAVEVLTDPDGGEALTAIPGVWRVMGLEALAVAHANLGRPDDAARVLGQAEAHAAGLGLPMAAAWAHRAAATVALRAGDTQAAAERALQAAAAAEEVGVVVEGALARLVAGRALAQAGEGERAVEEIERAAAVFDGCGAVPHRDAAEQELRRLGRTVHRRSRAAAGNGEGIDSLTGRELEVVRLVVDRRTNREIADELFLSMKTVETHLRNVFRKLDVSSRAEVARMMERETRR
jgi:ATP/maltotriose-dependent transcriptional regulator MalT